ncbi:hypothetical protein HOH54_03195 [bacterium]|nr:hypothetical protein [bacterium]
MKKVLILLSAVLVTGAMVARDMSSKECTLAKGVYKVINTPDNWSGLVKAIRNGSSQDEIGRNIGNAFVESLGKNYRKMTADQKQAFGKAVVTELAPALPALLKEAYASSSKSEQNELTQDIINLIENANAKASKKLKNSLIDDSMKIIKNEDYPQFAPFRTIITDITNKKYDIFGPQITATDLVSYFNDGFKGHNCKLPKAKTS